MVRVGIREGGFGVGEMNGVFGLAQCWKSLSKEECKICLEKAARDVTKCLPSNQGRALNAGCYLRYSTYKFYNHPLSSQQQQQHSKSLNFSFFISFSLSLFFIFVSVLILRFSCSELLRRGVITAIVLAVAAAAILFLSVFYAAFFSRSGKLKKGNIFMFKTSFWSSDYEMSSVLVSKPFFISF